MLGAPQLGLIDDEAALVAADPGRRAGKTTTFLGAALKKFETRDRAAVCYFAPSDEQGVDIVWEDLRDYNLRFDLKLQEHWSDRRWTQGGRVIEVLGFNTRRDAERARGRKFDLVWIDEAQLAPDWFAKLVSAAIMPTTLDYRGQVYTTGTPSEVAAGFFFEACHGQKWSNRHHWTCAQNPFFAGRDPLAEARQMYHLDAESVTYRREWLGEWIVDPDALVYAIPDAAIRPAPPAYHGYVLGLDFGWRDMDAIAVVGIDTLRQRSHLLHIEGKAEQTNHELFARIRELRATFPGPVVYDPAGHATKKTIETFRVDAPDIQWVQADKPRKVEYIQLLNDDLRAGKTSVEPESDMIREAKRLQWKRPGKVAEDADHSDLGDAWLYAWRHARDLLRELPMQGPKPQKDPFDRDMELMEQAATVPYFKRRLKEIRR